MIKVERIQTKGFGGGDFDLEFDSPVVFIHGPNGAGKSSVPAAIAFALTGKVPFAGGTSPGATIDAIGRHGASEAWAEVWFRDEDGESIQVGHRVFYRDNGGVSCQPSIMGKQTKPSSFERELIEMGIRRPEFIYLDWLVGDSRPNRGRAILDRFADPKKHGKVKLSLDEHKRKLKALRDDLGGKRSSIGTISGEIKRIEEVLPKGATIRGVEAEVAELREKAVERAVTEKTAEKKTRPEPAPQPAEQPPEAEAPPEPGQALTEAPPAGPEPEDGLDKKTLIAVSKEMRANGCACKTSVWVMREKMKARAK